MLNRGHFTRACCGVVRVTIHTIKMQECCQLDSVLATNDIESILRKNFETIVEFSHDGSLGVLTLY